VFTGSTRVQRYRSNTGENDYRCSTVAEDFYRGIEVQEHCRGSRVVQGYRSSTGLQENWCRTVVQGNMNSTGV